MNANVIMTNIARQRKYIEGLLDEIERCEKEIATSRKTIGLWRTRLDEIGKSLE